MKTSLSHLPETKQEQILNIVSVIKDVVDAEKIILYGSYARGTYQEDWYTENGTVYEYLSDYDFLVILKSKELPEYEIQDRIVNKVHYKQPLNVLISYMDYVNEGLEKGQYFFTEIINSGILLYDANTSAFSKPRELSNQERKEMAEEEYEQWFETGADYIDLAKLALKIAVDKNKKPGLAAYQLHQAVEALYATVMLVFTGYKPKTHNLEKYRSLLKTISKDVLEVFPPETKDRVEIELFDLLKRAYIGGRYKKSYQVSQDQIEQLCLRIIKLKSIVENLCAEKIKSYDLKIE